MMLRLAFTVLALSAAAAQAAPAITFQCADGHRFAVARYDEFVSLLTDQSGDEALMTQEKTRQARKYGGTGFSGSTYALAVEPLESRLTINGGTETGPCTPVADGTVKPSATALHFSCNLGTYHFLLRPAADGRADYLDQNGNVVTLAPPDGTTMMMVGKSAAGAEFDLRLRGDHAEVQIAGKRSYIDCAARD